MEIQSGGRGRARARRWHWFVWIDQARQDLRQAWRLMRRSPGFSIVTILTLALGLSANVTIFSLISVLLLKPLPVKDGDRLVVLMEQRGSSDSLRGLSWLNYREYRAQVPEFSDALALVFRPAHIGVAGRPPDRVWIEAVSGNYFSMLGVTPSRGRLFLPNEGVTPLADPVVVLAHDYWRTHFDSDPNVIGQAVSINGRAFTVIGITPPEFTSAQWSLAPRAFVPATMLPALFSGYEHAFDSREGGAFRVRAHLRPGVDVRQAAAAAQVVAQRLADAQGERTGQTGSHGANAAADPSSRVRLIVRPETQARPIPELSRFMPFAAVVFLALAAMVLFIACANVAHVMFSRALGRQRELAIRAAVGASRARLIRQLLTESLCLALFAGAAGTLLSYVSGQLLSGIAPQGDVPVRPDDGWDWRVVLFTMAVSVIAGVVTGLAPALRGTALDVHSIVKGSGGIGSGARAGRGRGRRGLRSRLVTSQIALCVVILVCGGLFLQSLRAMSSHDLGFRAERLLLASIDLDLPGYDVDRGRRLIEQISERARAMPGVEAAAIGSSVPFDVSHEFRTVTRADAASASASGGGRGGVDTSTGASANAGGELRAAVNRVGPGYLQSIGATLLRGRDIMPQDRGSAPRVALINQTLAARLWPGEDPLHKQFRWQRRAGSGSGASAGGSEPIEVIGVVRDGKYVSVSEAPRAYAYVPLAQDYSSSITLHVRASNSGQTGDAGAIALTSSLRRVVQETDPDLAVFNVRTMTGHLRNSVFALLPLRMGAMFASAQGLLGLLLAVMSVYGVVAYSVRQQTHDLGVRMALGAQPGDLLRLVTRGALRQTLIGLGAGVVASLAVTRLLAAWLYGLSATHTNLTVIAAVVALVFGVALIACWLPARRALNVDPVITLRAD